MAETVPVLIVGAGPTGLVLALWLTRLGVAVRIVDKTAEPGTTSRALVVQSRTLELYRQAGLAAAVVARGRKVTALNLWVAGKQAAHVPLGEMGRGISPFTNPIVFAQDEHERLLVERLAELGVAVERRTELLAFEEADGRVLARLKGPDGAETTQEAAFIAGCDGAHSAVRGTLGIGFPGGTYAHLYYVADVAARGPVMDGAIHVAFAPHDFLAVFPLQGEGRARLVGTVRDEAGTPQRDDLGWDDVSKRVLEQMHIDVERVNWFSTYRVHHRVADRFREGRAFLLGDAAHIHSPVGGQGMNTGIGDAINLAWKLEAVLAGGAPMALLDSYEAERIAFARRLVATTDRAFTGVTSDRRMARRLRLDIVPRLLPLFFQSAPVRRLLFRTVSQTGVNYRRSRLSAGRAGPLRGGDRLPWVPVRGADNFTPLTGRDWQVHVYGQARAGVADACQQLGVLLHTFAWQPRMRRQGVRRGALYLVRPDGYLALVDRAGGPVRLTAYFRERGISVTPGG